MLDLPVEAPELVLYRGDDRVQEYVLRKPDGGPVDVGSWDLVCQVRRANPSRLVGVPVASPGPGRIVLSFPAEFRPTYSQELTGRDGTTAVPIVINPNGSLMAVASLAAGTSITVGSSYRID